MDALKSLLDNEKGLVGVGLIIAATILVLVNKMTIDQWQSFCTWAFGIYAGSTALHGGLVAIGTGSASTAPTTAPTSSTTASPEVTK